MASEFHRPDHSPFAAFGVGLAYGLRADGEIVTIGQSVSGKACGCVCPACGEALVGKKGPRITDHFAHVASGVGGCGLGAETNAHLWAKSVLEALKQIRLPAIEACVGDRRHQTHKSRTYVFVDAILERRLGEIVPDVVLIAADGRRLIVEVMVTHACGEEKIAKIRSGGVSAIEVDLSAYRVEGTEAAVREALLRLAPRAWLFNPAVDAAQWELRAEIAEEQKRKADAKKRVARRAAEAMRGAEPRITDVLRKERQRIVDIGLGDLALLPPASDDGFVVPSSLWRSALISRLVLQRKTTRHGMLWPIEDDEPMDLIRDCLAPRVVGRSPAPTAEAMKAALPGFVPPDESVAQFVEILTDRCLLYENKHGLLINEQARDDLLAREAESKASAQRKTQADNALGRLFEAAGTPFEGEGFSLSAWRDALPGFDAPLDGIVATGGINWLQWLERIDAITSMIEGGVVCNDLIGLPFEHLQVVAYRQAELIAAKEALDLAAAERAAAETRIERLRLRGAHIPGFNVGAWLVRPGKGITMTPADAARRDEDGFAMAMRSLDGIEEDFAMRAARAALRAECQAQLEIAAAKVYGGERLRLFLNGHRPELGMKSPMEFCEDQAALRFALPLLGPAKRRR